MPWSTVWARWAAVACMMLVWLVGPLSTAVAEPALVDDFTRNTFALQMSDRAGSARLVAHDFDTRRSIHAGRAERVVLACAAGDAAAVTYNLPRAPVIKELELTVWTMCNRPGVRLAARVILPRSINPATGQPYTLLVRGGLTERSGAWQSLRIDRFPQRTAEQARIARVQYDPAIDEREAYVDQIVLLVPGGTSPTELLVDRVDVSGVIQSNASPAGANASLAGAVSAAGSNSASPSTPAGSRPTPPLVPRIIQWQGEPWEFLAQMGFDAIAMKRTATAEELAKARQLGLFLVCPPPSARNITEHGIGEPFAPVMAWDLGSLQSEAEVDVTLRWQELLHRHDPVDSRPSIIVPGPFPQPASRIADIALLGRDRLAGQLPVRDYAAWLHQQRQLLRPGTQVWSQVETDLAPAVVAQLATHSAGRLGAVVSPERLDEEIALAATIKSRGFYFTSHTALNSGDLASKRRAISLQLLNLKLGMIEPWLASGKMIASARSNDPNLTAAVLKVERSHLLVPIRWDSSGSPIASPNEASDPTHSISMIVPGVPESCEAYLLSPAGTDRLRHRRVTGGVRIFFDAGMPDGLVLLTEDGYAFSQVARYLRQHALQTAKLYRDLAAVRLQQAVESVRTPMTVAASSDASHPMKQVLDLANRKIAECDALLQRRSSEAAYRSAAEVNGMLRQVEQTLVAATSRQTAPLAAQSLVGHFQNLTTGRPSARLQQPAPQTAQRNAENCLAAADFEDLNRMVDAGWQHRRLPIQGVATAVRLSPVAPHGGRYCLELEAESAPADQSSDAAQAPPVITTPPVWVVSAPVAVRAGEVLEISGMVRVPQPLLGSVDGLQIFDSLGGRSLALRFGQTPSWQPFRIVRTAPADTEVTVTFALAGLGSVQIDDVVLRRLETSPTARQTAPKQR